MVRVNDCMEWKLKTLESASEKLIYPFLCEDGSTWSQCRHIDEFCTGDKVQIKIEQESEEWHDAVYAFALPQSNHWPHAVYNKAQTDIFAVKYVRWHPSMPWAEKEEVEEEPYWAKAIIRLLEAIESKLNEK